MFLRFTILLTATMAVSGCVVQRNPAKSTVYTPNGVYEYHCPPGQAKKGKC